MLDWIAGEEASQLPLSYFVATRLERRKRKLRLESVFLVDLYCMALMYPHVDQRNDVKLDFDKSTSHAYHVTV